MGNDTVAFKEAAELVRQGVQPENIGDVPYIGLEHFEEGTLRLLGIGDSKDIASTKFRFAKGDILFGKLRPYFRKVIRAPFAGVCSTDIWVVRSKPGFDQGYLYYCMASPDFVNFASQGSEGTKMPRAKWEHAGRFPLRRAEMCEQRAISHILGSLDDKIELNRQMNKTLEDMARAIFKSWFVDFDPVRAKAEGRDTGLPDEIAALFPDGFQDSEIGEIPRGWEVLPLPELFDVNPPRTLKKGQIAPYLEMKNMPEHSMRPLGWYDREYGSGVKFVNGDTLVARVTPCLENGKGAFVDFLKDGQVGWGSTEYIVLRSKEPLPLEYSYFLSRTSSFRSHAIVNMTGSSGRQRVPPTVFDSYLVAKPNERIAKYFSMISGPITRKLKKNDVESQTLASLRDTLLPKLISGELRVPDAEKFVKEAGL